MTADTTDPYYYPFAPAVGKVLIRLSVGPEEGAIRLDFTEGPPLYVVTTGDCCSESWWADIVGVESCLGSQIREAIEIQMPEDDTEPERTRQDSDARYGYTLFCERGVISLVFRNSSNGYYGGSAYGTHDEPRHFDDGQNVWTPIETNNWRA